MLRTRVPYQSKAGHVSKPSTDRAAAIALGTRVEGSIPSSADDITADFVQDVVHAAGLDASVGAVTVEPLGSARGFACELLRVTPHYIQASAVAPASFVAKLPSRTPEAVALAHALDLWNVESLCYEGVLPRVPVRVPVCWYNGADPATDQFALLIEDLSAMSTVDQVAGLKPKQSELVIDWLAGLHSAFWNSEDLPQQVMTGAQSDALVAPAIESLLSVYADSFADLLPDGSMARVEQLLEPFAQGRLAQSAHTTLIHGDLRGDNVMYDDDEIVAVDWQGVRRAPGTRDVAYILTTSVPIEDRREMEERLITRYRDALLSAGADPGNRDEVWESYRLGVATSMMIQVLAGGHLAGADERSRRLIDVAGQRVFGAAADLDIGGGMVA